VIEVALLTGFLGAGKTSLLRRLLADPRLADTAVLINEFGEIGLDHHLLERIDARTVLLQSGCVCCTVRGELAQALRDLLSRRERGAVPPFARAVIETTGLADPYPALSTLRADAVLRHHVVPGNVVTVVDAVNGAANLAHYPISARQVAAADRLMVSKTDLADAATTSALLAALRAINPTAPVLRAAEAPLDAAALLAPDAAGARAWFGSALTADAPAHDANVQAFALTFDEPLDWAAFGLWLAMLLNRHGARVLRVKAILAVAGAQAPVAVHGVQHLVHPPVHLSAWPDADRRSRLVFIVQGLERAAIERSLRAFLGVRDQARAA
jgi:G3E family GTPase